MSQIHTYTIYILTASEFYNKQIKVVFPNNKIQSQNSQKVTPFCFKLLTNSNIQIKLLLWHRIKHEFISL